MLKKYVLLRNIIDKTLIDLKLQSLILSEEEFHHVKDLVEALEIVEVGSRKLCQRKVTLGLADRILEFMLAKLYKLTTSIGIQLYTNVESRIKERRNKGASTLQAFLEDHEFLDEIEHGGIRRLEYAQRNEITKLACFLYIRLFKSDDEDPQTIEDPDDPGKPESL